MSLYDSNKWIFHWQTLSTILCSKLKNCANLKVVGLDVTPRDTDQWRRAAPSPHPIGTRNCLSIHLCVALIIIDDTRCGSEESNRIFYSEWFAIHYIIVIFIGNSIVSICKIVCKFVCLANSLLSYSDDHYTEIVTWTLEFVIGARNVGKLVIIYVGG